MINKPAEPLSFSSRYFQREQMLATASGKEQTEIQLAKDEVFVPWLVKRLQMMHEAGLPIPEHWLDPRAELLKGIALELDPALVVRGKYDSDQVAITLKSCDTHKILEFGPMTEGKYLVHEFWHFISGVDVRTDLHGKALTPERDAGFGVVDQNWAGRLALLEATTESLTRWTISKEEVDFRGMDAKTFFEGPSDVPKSVYRAEQILLGKILDDTPADILLKAYFADTITVNGQTIDNPDYIRFEQALFGKIHGGWDGLTWLCSKIQNPVANDKVDDLFEEIVELFDAIVTDWQADPINSREQARFERSLTASKSRSRQAGLDENGTISLYPTTHSR